MRFILLLALLLHTGCVSTYKSSHKVDQTLFERGGMGIVIVQAGYYIDNHYIVGENIWTAIDDNYATVDENNVNFLVGEQQLEAYNKMHQKNQKKKTWFGVLAKSSQEHMKPTYQAYMVQAGKYVLNRISQGYVLDHLGYDLLTDSTNYASFEIKPGEVIYIGDITYSFKCKNNNCEDKSFLSMFSQRNNHLHIQVTNHKEQAEQYFNQYYPNFKEPIKTRLVQVSKRGYQGIHSYVNPYPAKQELPVPSYHQHIKRR